jgi:hypothetical protein
MVQGTKRTFLVASVAATGAFFVVALVLGLISSWFEMPYMNPDGTPDNAPIRAAGILIMLSPLIFVLFAAVVFLTALMLQRIRRLTPRGLLTVVVLASVGTAALMVSDRPFGWKDMLYYFCGFAVTDFLLFGSAAWAWWKVAMRPNSAAHPDAREASHLLSPSQSRAGGRERWASPV